MAGSAGVARASNVDTRETCQGPEESQAKERAPWSDVTAPEAFSLAWGTFLAMLRKGYHQLAVLTF